MKPLPIKKAIFPVAGLGSRFLPATKATPKEMMPIVDKPLIQYAVEEAIAAGINQLIFVTSNTKRAIEDHFDTNFELEKRLEEAEKKELLAIVKNILPKGISCVYIRQAEPKGLGHAIRCAKHLINHEPFAVLLADDLIEGEPISCLEQMIKAYKEFPHSILAVQPVPLSETEKYGIVELKTEKSSNFQTIQHIIEKPNSSITRSNLAVVGRYILTPSIFNYLAEEVPEFQLEIQLTDGISKLLEIEPVLAYQFQGKRFDCGDKLGYLQAIVHYGLKHPDLNKQFREYLYAHQFNN
ncbi:MAG: galU [Francisellaceae bacterium]|nr:galU [Francisellaceae bacterium]